MTDGSVAPRPEGRSGSRSSSSGPEPPSAPGGQQFELDGSPELATQAVARIDVVESALAEANTPQSLLTLNARIAAIQELVRKIGLDLSEQNRLAISRIRAGRKLGALLAQSVSRGGCGSNSHRVSSKPGGCSAPLPDGVSHAQSSRFQRLAGIPGEDVEKYVAEASARREAIAVKAQIRAARRYAKARGDSRGDGSGGQQQTTRPRPPKTPSVPAIDERLRDAIRRTMKKVDLAVGLRAAAVGAEQSFRVADPEVVTGSVVAVTRDYAAWLDGLGHGRNSGRVDEAILVFRPGSWHWLEHLVPGCRAVCFVQEDPGRWPTIVGYVGERAMAFECVFRDLGAVFEVPRR